MNRYKSWSNLNKQLTERLCQPLKNRISYFLTRYRKVHNAYGRASIRFDGKDLINFSWVEMYKKDYDVNERWKETGVWDYDDRELKDKWDFEGTFSDYDFLEAAADFLQLPVKDALQSDNYLIRVFAIMDKRVGKRTLEAIRNSGEYKSYPEWVQRFYELRFQSQA
ncbi:MAG: hypothetical protein GX082_03040 [Clostridiaceae bacterium]|jgi:hypothetical protein|nr:hypothetical protein [Clostridiaceae bacterium]